MAALVGRGENEFFFFEKEPVFLFYFYFFLSQTLNHGNALHRCETLYFKQVPGLKHKMCMLSLLNMVKNLFVHGALSWICCETCLCRERTCYKAKPSEPMLKP